MSKEKAIEKIQYAVMQVASVYACSAIFDEKTKFRDNGELKKAYESQKDSLADLANSSWAKALKEYVASKNQEDGVDAKLPDIDELIKKLASDEFIEKKIKDILGENDVDSGKEK